MLWTLDTSVVDGKAGTGPKRYSSGQSCQELQSLALGYEDMAPLGNGTKELGAEDLPPAAWQESQGREVLYT